MGLTLQQEQSTTVNIYVFVLLIFQEDVDEDDDKLAELVFIFTGKTSNTNRVLVLEDHSNKKNGVG